MAIGAFISNTIGFLYSSSLSNGTIPNILILAVIAIGVILAVISMLPRLRGGYGAVSGMGGGMRADPGTDLTPGADYR